MNDNLDEWLNSIGVTTATTVPPQPVDGTRAADTQAESDNADTPLIRIHVENVFPTPDNISEQDFADILQASGFNASEEADAEEIEGEDEEDEESNNRDLDVGLDVGEDSDWDSGRITSAARFIGTGELTQIGDMRIDSHTGDVEMLTAQGVIHVANSISEEDMAVAPATTQAISETDYTWDVIPPEHESQETANTSTDIDEHHLPENSPTLLIDETTSRFSGAEWYDEIQKKRVIFAGLGGIGSWSSLLIGRMGLNAFTLYDDDKVERGNMSGQLYSRIDINDYKVDAMRKLLNCYTSTCCVFANRRRYEENSANGNIMICGFDNMEARKTFFNSWKRNVLDLPTSARQQCLFIDGRLSMDTLQVFCIQGDDEDNQKRYEEEFLFSDDDADETVCSMKQTSYLAAMIGSVITNLFTNWVAQSLDPIIPYDIPFFTEYNAQHMIFKTEH